MIKSFHDSFKNEEDLIDNIRRGGEVEFEYNNKLFSITHLDGSIHVMEQNNYDSEMIYFEAEDVGEYSISGNKLNNILSEIKVIFRCF